MNGIASQITSFMIVYSTVYSDADQRKHQSSASLAFVWGIHRGPVNSTHKWPVSREMFPFDDVIMWFCCWGVIDSKQQHWTKRWFDTLRYFVDWVSFNLLGIQNALVFLRSLCQHHKNERWASSRPKSSATRLFVHQLNQTAIKENINTLYYMYYPFVRGIHQRNTHAIFIS